MRCRHTPTEVTGQCFQFGLNRTPQWLVNAPDTWIILYTCIAARRYWQPDVFDACQQHFKFGSRTVQRPALLQRKHTSSSSSTRFWKQTIHEWGDHGKITGSCHFHWIAQKYAMQNSMTAWRDPRSVMGIVAPWCILKLYIITTLGLFTRSLKKKNTCCVTQGSGMTSFLGICRFNGGFVHCYMKSILTHLFDSTDDYLISWLEGDVMYDAEFVTQGISQLTL